MTDPEQTRCMSLDQIFNSSKDLQAVIDVNHEVRHINEAYMHYIGTSLEQAIGGKCQDLFKGSYCDSQACPLKQVLEKKEPVEMEVIKKGCDKMAVPFLLTATPLRAAGGEIMGMIASFKDISTLKESEYRLKNVIGGTINAMAEIVELRDPYTAGHQRRVAKIAGAIAGELGLPAPTIDTVITAATLHDIGKIYVPSLFLAKPGKLSNLEFEIIKTHSVKGYEILNAIPFDVPIAEIIRQHHERVDGSGYPDGLSGDFILPEARIISVSDVLEAVSSHRPYRKSLGIETAFREIERNKGVKYDEGVVDVCMKMRSAIMSILE